MFANGYHPLTPGKIAAVVTYLEMTARPPERPPHDAERLAIRPMPMPDLDWYRALFRAVGQDWLWFSRLSMSDDPLKAIIHNPDVEVFALLQDDSQIGLLELDFRKPAECELAYFGVTKEAIGSGAARFLMEAAIARAWSRKPALRRFFVHTCTLDHPAAVAFYERSGFKAYARAVEIADDPRLDGRLPRDAAGWFPAL
jgi:GNAT superfamily N-acetyltransferase